MPTQVGASTTSNEDDEQRRSETKRLELDLDEKVDAVDRIRRTANVDNLVDLPLEILLDIFHRTDDISLIRLANTCKRFATIAEKFFLITGESSNGGPEAYSAESIQLSSRIILNHIEGIADNHWAVKLIQPHIERIRKLTFNSCTFKTTNILLSVPLNAKQLTFRHHRFHFREPADDIPRTIYLPECRNLTKLEIHSTAQQSFFWDSLAHVIRNNTALQSLLLYEWPVGGAHTWDMLHLIADHLKGIKELAIIKDRCERGFIRKSRQDIAHNSFKHLESLALSVGNSSIYYLTYFDLGCKRIKHLGLRSFVEYAVIKQALVYFAGLFQKIESFHYYQYEHYYAYGNDHSIDRSLDALVEHLPNLRHLNVEPAHTYGMGTSQILSLLKKRITLQQVTVIFKDHCEANIASFISANFFEDFIQTINATGKSNARIEVVEHDEIVGSVSANGTVWRNKLMYWTGCDRNDTNTQLLDLANHSEKTQDAAEQTNLLDKICNYLDIESLVVLAKLNDRSKQLVNSYVKKHVQKEKTFIITDEFYPHVCNENHSANCSALEFAPLATDLSVCIIKSKSRIAKIIENYGCLKKLLIYDGCADKNWPIIRSNVSHIVYDSLYAVGHTEFIDIIYGFPNAETIEFKNAGQFNDVVPAERNATMFGRLKVLRFNYRGKAQTENLKKMFGNTNVQLVPVYSV